MPSTLENPFTPKSAVPQKRLFGGEEKVVKRKLSKEAQERIQEAKEKFVQYGEHKILKSQVEFLYELEKELMEIAKQKGKELSKKDIVERVAEKIKVDEDGNIKKIVFYNMNLETLPSLDKLKNLKELICRQNKLISLPSLDKLTNLRILNCDGNELTSLPNLDKLINLQELHCFKNKLISLPNLDKLINLKLLACSKNHFSAQEIAKIKSQVPKYCNEFI